MKLLLTGVVPPYYLPAAQLELQEYLDHLVSELPRPVFLCDVSALTKGCFEPDALRRFAGACKKNACSRAALAV